MNEIVLENELMKAIFDARTGALASFVSKQTQWQIQRRPELGLSFRMLVPLEGRRNNPVLGEKQAAPKVLKNKDGSVTFVWTKVRSEFGGEHDISFAGTVAMGEYGLTFTAHVENRSGQVIETVSWPCLGDVTAPKGDDNKLERWAIGYGNVNVTPIFPKFSNAKGYYGVDYPINFADSPYTPFVLSHTGKQGFYAATHDPKAPMMVAYCYELKPGYASTTDPNNGTVPIDEIAGLPAHIEFTAIHFPFYNAGETGDLQPIVLAPYVGSWHKGVDIYRKWRKTWFRRHKAPAWVKDIHSWLQIHINSPEDELRCQYKDLVKYGEDCARHGVKAIQLVGWNDGGQDRGNPSHDIDPRLGTWQDLKDAVDKCEALGVRMIMFNKYTWSDRSLEWFRNDLVKYAMKDPYGDYHVYGGYQYQTAVQLMDLNTRRLIPMCHNAKPWREIACKEFKKSIDLGASGMLFDESQHHGGARYCWDPSHGHHVPAFVYGQGDAQLEADFHELTDPLKPDYLFAGEMNYDMQYQNYHLSYFRIEATGHIAYQRYTDPEEEMMIAITGFDDRLMANRCLMHRYIISYEPFNFKGRLDDFPKSLEYGKKVDALRTRYREFLWDGDYLDTQGATVKIGDANHPHYSVFKSRTGKLAVVVANFGEKEWDCTVTLEGAPAATLAVVTPESPEPKPVGSNVKLGPSDVVVLIQQ